MESLESMASLVARLTRLHIPEVYTLPWINQRLSCAALKKTILKMLAK